MATAEPAVDPRMSNLASRVRGEVLFPGAPAYEAVRAIWNAEFDRRPGAIVRCRGVADVVAAVDHARGEGIPLAVRGGGHSFAGLSSCDGGLLVDLSPMKGVRVDPQARRARVEAGVTWGEFDHEAQAFGLATTGGTVSGVGVAGYTLGGGTGYLARKHGLAVDNLVSADVVTADGSFLRTSEEENPDLFWALRGGGGNFGVVTSFEFRLHEVGPEVLAGQIVHRFDDARRVMELYREYMAEAPDEVTCYPFFLRLPPAPVFPEELHGRPVVSLVMAHVGPVETAQEELRPLLEFGDPVLPAVQPMPYVAAQRMFDEGMPKGHRHYSKAQYVGGIPDAAIDTLLEYAANLQGPFTAAYFEPAGGAVNRRPPDATAFPHRDAAYTFHILAGWEDPADREPTMAWTRELHDAMSVHAVGGVYVNLMGHDEAERVPEAYGPNYDRLAELKRKYDPENLFRFNQNIAP